MNRQTSQRLIAAIIVLGVFILFIIVGVRSYNDVDQRAREEVAKEQQENEESSKKGQVRVGMTADQCRAAWGKPDRVNRTRNASGVHDQWVYDDDHYLYLDSGVLRSIQGIGRPESAPWISETTASSVASSATTIATHTPPSLPQFVTLTQPASIPVQYGEIGLQRGTRLQLIAIGAEKAHVRYNGADYWIPIQWTDLR